VKFGFELKNKSDLTTTTDKNLSTASVLIACETLEQKREWLKDIKALVKDHQVAEAKRRAIAQGMERREKGEKEREREKGERERERERERELKDIKALVKDQAKRRAIAQGIEREKGEEKREREGAGISINFI
jgi:hypothetical protein